MPEVKSLLNKNTSDEAFIEREQHSMEAFYVGAEEAKTNCSTSSCEPTGWKAYRTAIADYVSRRENVTRNLYRKRGDEGLEIASRVFGTERDRDIIKHLKEVSTAEKFEINKLGIAKQSAALLVHRGPDSYKPCSDPDHVTSP